MTEGDRTPIAVRTKAALDRLASAGLRRTTGRAEVLSLLAASGRHLSGGQVFEQLRAAGSLQDRATVWRTLSALSDLGLVHVLHHDGADRYGLADVPHHHAVCGTCGKVTELEAGRMAGVVAAAEAASGFRLGAAGLHLAGTCPDCLNAV